MRSRTWHFLFGWSHKNPLRSLIFQVLKRLFGTNVESVMSEGERNPERRPGSPLGWPERRMERPVANEANEMSGENVSKNLKTSVILIRIFVTITPNKKWQRPWSNMRCGFSPFNEIPQNVSLLEDNLSGIVQLLAKQQVLFQQTLANALTNQQNEFQKTMANLFQKNI